MNRMDAQQFVGDNMQVINRVVEIKTVTIRVTKQGRERRDRLIKAGLCLACEEPVKRGAIRRGCCAACRQYIKRMSEKNGGPSLESFIRAGKLLESKERGGVRPHPKRLALRKQFCKSSVLPWL